jgi:hypothetical protein
MNRRLLVFVASLLLAAVVGFFYVAPAVAARRNGVLHKGPYKAGEAARKVHAGLFVADLHADSLLWGRDLARRGTSGHVDLPRLIEGNVGLQAFTIVTKSPRNMNIERNSGDTDNITLLAMAQRWPVASWSSLTERALYQARKLDELAKRSGGRFTLVRDVAALESYLSKRMVDPTLTAGFLGVEGARKRRSYRKRGRDDQADGGEAHPPRPRPRLGADHHRRARHREAARGRLAHGREGHL